MDGINQLKQERILAIKTTVLFRSCNDRLLEELETEFTDVHLTKDEVLFREGEAGDSLYIIIRGKLGIYTVDKQVVVQKKG